MKSAWLLFAALFLGPMAPACAHRLDEYLQATTIDVARDQLTLQLRLTPGVIVAPQVLAGIGVSGDGVIPDTLQRGYAERVRRDLSLTVDGTAQPLRLISVAFPTAAAVRDGVGDILLTFEVNLPASRPAHRLVFENHHQRAIAVYLVNCLLPRDPHTRILAQDRNADQSFYQLDFTVGGATGPTRTTPSSPAGDD